MLSSAGWETTALRLQRLDYVVAELAERKMCVCVGEPSLNSVMLLCTLSTPSPHPASIRASESLPTGLELANWLFHQCPAITQGPEASLFFTGLRPSCFLCSFDPPTGWLC